MYCFHLTTGSIVRQRLFGAIDSQSSFDVKRMDCDNYTVCHMVRTFNKLDSLMSLFLFRSFSRQSSMVFTNSTHKIIIVMNQLVNLMRKTTQTSIAFKIDVVP